MKVRVDVMLKAGVLDPQGKAVEHALAGLGFKGVSNVRIGKTIQFEAAGNDEAKIKSEVTQMAEKLLANTVIEDYKITIN
ncbi:MAG: phosphoribosylformylglycinamidine synthase subunit PurS [Alphaproteobacteria bacterium]|nr:phosphoribosylformylglycinamidine synthase subunit PurS [Alphaproteobacteria bacterium]MCL2505151.1 phosphoribosylformylglycinamidine synthase subunit PurS [Alphaproteobacteria bacterium]